MLRHHAPIRFAALFVSLLCLTAASLNTTEPGDDPSTTTQALSPAGPMTVSLVVSNGLGPVWKAPDETAREALKRTREELATGYEEALAVDLGNWSLPVMTYETAYNTPVAAYFAEAEYAAVNVAPRDYLSQVALGFGLNFMDEVEQQAYVGTMDREEREGGVALSAYRLVGTADGKPVTFVGLSDPGDLRTFPLVHQELSSEAPEAALERALAEGQGPVVVLSGLRGEQERALAERYPAVDVILSAEEGPAEAERVGERTFWVPRAPANEFQCVSGHWTPEGGFEGLEVERTAWIGEEEFAALSPTYEPLIGVSIRPPEAITQRFSIEEQNIQIEVHRGTPLPELTPRGSIYAYLVEAEGTPYRLYRVIQSAPPGGLGLDALVLLNADHTLRTVESNSPTFPVAGLDSSFAQALAGLSNLAPEEWQVDPALVRGFEPEAQAVLEALRRVVEVDRRLYPGKGE